MIKAISSASLRSVLEEANRKKLKRDNVVQIIYNTRTEQYDLIYIE